MLDSTNADLDPLLSVTHEVGPRLEMISHNESTATTSNTGDSGVVTESSAQQIDPRMTGPVHPNSHGTVSNDTREESRANWARILQEYPQQWVPIFAIIISPTVPDCHSSPEYNRAIMFFNAVQRMLGPLPRTSEDEDDIYCDNMLMAFGAK